jgi:peptidoglycan/xylan/chitin deacetylase (PgdA/CDA1 family)
LNKKDKRKTIKYYIERDKRRKKLLKLLLFVLSGIILVAALSSVIFGIEREKGRKEEAIKLEKEKIVKEHKKIMQNIKNNYNSYVITIKNAKIYKLVNNEYIDSGTISDKVVLNLKDKKIKDYKDIYFELNNINYFIKYTDVKIYNGKNAKSNYKYYVPFNQNINSKGPTIFYDDNGGSYTINDSVSLPVIIRDTDRYYVEFDNKLLYIKTGDNISVIDHENSTAKIASKIAVIAYHYTYDSAAGEKCLSTIICHDVNQIKSQFDYLNKNGFYTTTLKDLELYLTGKIRLPEKSVTITVDDGWWFDRMYTLANEYKVNVTLFFIGNLQNNADILAYSKSSDYVQFASHTYNLHNVGVCPGGQGSPLKCASKDVILADLKKSREQLNNTTYIAWPFYEYNDYAVNIIKQAGFTMALTGGMYKAYPGVNMYAVPRYTIHNDTTLQEFQSYIYNN